MVETYRFYKEDSGQWYIDLPEWTGSKSDLQMVYGADDLLEVMANGEIDINVRFGNEPFNESHVMSFMMDGVLGDRDFGGGTYRLHQYRGQVLDLNLWLCDVTKFLFGEMPALIHFNRI